MTFDRMQGSLDIAALHAAYRSGTLTPEALIEALYARMEQDPTPNAWIYRICREEALARARELGAFGIALPLFGVPFAVKDNIDVAGMPTSAACPAFVYHPERSAPVVDALLTAGALCLGKVNLDQFATGLVGTRSPYGACQNVFDPTVLSGGSSSGSAVTVAAHHVSFSLGTDTAGSGRVPAALNNIVGLKPSVGLLSSDGVVPACASLDCISVFAPCVDDAQRVLQVAAGEAAHHGTPLPARFRFGVPSPLELFGDAQSLASFEAAQQQLVALGGTPVPVDFAPFSALGDMLYGPSVVERYLAVGSFIEAQPEAVLPVTREIIMRGKSISPAERVAGMRRIASLRAACLRALDAVDVLLTPTVPAPQRIAEDAADPRAVNDRNGIYTRFVNYLGCPALSVPVHFRADGLPFGVSLVGRPGHDRSLAPLADKLHALSGAGMGRRRHPVPAGTGAEPSSPARAAAEPSSQGARVAVVGAHMQGLALNGQLQEVGATFVKTTRTAPEYRFYVLPGTQPERPGLVRVREGGVAIELEIWDMSWAALGTLMGKVPAPLSIGTLSLAGDETVKGFLCESYAAQGARDVSELGGFRNYLKSKSTQ